MPLVIAGERSGVGKTTITLALLAALRHWGQSVQAYKVGPDYIDPMFHQWVTGRPAYTLDPVLTSEAYVQECYGRHLTGARCGLVEGVMGLFDGAGGTDWGSTAHVARLLNLPVVLVVDCGRLSQSIAALVQGYRSFDPRLSLAGVVLNRVGSDRHQAMLRAAIAPLHLPILGVLPRRDMITLPDRHLGLVPTDELPDLGQRLEPFAALGRDCFDWEQLRPLLAVDLAPTLKTPSQGSLALREGAVHLPCSQGAGGPAPNANPVHQSQRLYPREMADQPPSSLAAQGLGTEGSRVQIAVARDRAFNFYYADNLALLTHLGADLCFFSPLSDTALPQGSQGLYLGGGFPEMFGADLGANTALRGAIAAAIAAGLPTLAECGGLMYLSQSLTDLAGETWPMVGVLPTATTMTPRLTLGYRRLVPQRPSVLVTPQEGELWSHEFHRSMATCPPSDPLYQTQPFPIAGYPDPAPQPEGWAMGAVYASYSHLHWGDRGQLPARFLRHCHRAMG